MTTAQEVLDQAHAALAETDRQIRNHPYLAEIRAGTVTLEALRSFPGHQYHLWRSDLRSTATMVQRFGDLPYGDFFINDLQAEVAAREQILVLAAKLGMSEADLEAFEPTPDGFAYTAYFAWLSMYGSAAEVACGVAVNFAAWGHNCGEVSKGLKEHYSVTEDEARFLDDFANLPSFDSAAAVIIEDDLKKGVEPRVIVRAARLIQAYEQSFWDAMLAATR
ncbi:MAG: hypothetical protein AAF414_15715 [Pseudomonadota bacterium]